jgi:hypothetical protein
MSHNGKGEEMSTRRKAVEEVTVSKEKREKR